MTEIKPSMICGQPYADKSPCSGDSGGPFVCQNENNNAVITGIVSFGPSNCSHVPVVYTRVTHYLVWIKFNMVIFTYSNQ